jgi:hypothetical protein
VFSPTNTITAVGQKTQPQAISICGERWVDKNAGQRWFIAWKHIFVLSCKAGLFLFHLKKKKEDKIEISNR